MGSDEVAVPVNLKHFKEVLIGSAIVRADSLVSLAHFKLHEASGFGGAIKNIGMGTASTQRQNGPAFRCRPESHFQKVHRLRGLYRAMRPRRHILVERPAGAPGPERLASRKSCGSTRNFARVARAAFTPARRARSPSTGKKIFQSLWKRWSNMPPGALKGKENRSLFINFLTQISPACDCYSFCGCSNRRGYRHHRFNRPGCN